MGREAALRSRSQAPMVPRPPAVPPPDRLAEAAARCIVSPTKLFPNMPEKEAKELADAMERSEKLAIANRNIVKQQEMLHANILERVSAIEGRQSGARGSADPEPEAASRGRSGPRAPRYCRTPERRSERRDRSRTHPAGAPDPARSKAGSAGGIISAWRGGGSRTEAVNPVPIPPPPPPPPAIPKQPNRKERRAAERAQRLIDDPNYGERDLYGGLCRYCKQPGHMGNECPGRPLQAVRPEDMNPTQWANYRKARLAQRRRAERAREDAAARDRSVSPPSVHDDAEEPLEAADEGEDREARDSGDGDGDGEAVRGPELQAGPEPDDCPPAESGSAAGRDSVDNDDEEDDDRRRRVHSALRPDDEDLM